MNWTHLQSNTLISPPPYLSRRRHRLSPSHWTDKEHKECTGVIRANPVISRFDEAPRASLWQLPLARFLPFTFCPTVLIPVFHRDEFLPDILSTGTLWLSSAWLYLYPPFSLLAGGDSHPPCKDGISPWSNAFTSTARVLVYLSTGGSSAGSLGMGLFRRRCQNSTLLLEVVKPYAH